MTDPILIRPLDAGDAAKLTACFERCYGDSYPAAFFYDPAAIRERIGDGRLHSVVAMTPSGEIVGHMALTRRHPGALTVEAGKTTAIVGARAPLARLNCSRFSTRSNCSATSGACVTNSSATFSARQLSRTSSITCC